MLTKSENIPVINMKEVPLDTPGGRIRQARLEKNMFINEVAKQVGITKEALSSMERNKITLKLETLKKLSIILEKPIWYFGCFENLPEVTFGDKIKKARLYLGLEKGEFANLFNVDKKSIYNWENDLFKPKNPEFILEAIEIIKKERVNFYFKT